MRTASVCRSNKRDLRLTLALVLFSLLLSELSEAGPFAPTGSLATPRDDFTATILATGEVLVAGGYDGTNQLSKSELCDQATGLWATTGALHSRCSVHATLLPNGEVLVAAGFNYASNDLSGAELYSATPNPPFPGSQPAMLTSFKILANGSFQFEFPNAPSARFSVLATTIPTLPLSYRMKVGSATEVAPGQFQFVDN